MFGLFTIIFILIGSTSVLVYLGINDTYPLIVCLYALVGLLFTILEWRDYAKTKNPKRNRHCE